MKARDHERIIRNIEARHAAQVRKLRQISADRLCSYLTDQTLAAAFAELFAIADAGAQPLLAVLSEHLDLRMAGNPPVDAGDICTRCTAPIDHGEPHLLCDGCRGRL